MTTSRRIVLAIQHITSILGIPGWIIAGVSLVSFLFGIVLIFEEYDHLRRAGQTGLTEILRDWVASAPVDDLGRNLRDYAVQWDSAEQPVLRDQCTEALRAAIENLGAGVVRPLDDRFGLVYVTGLELVAPGEPSVARWRSGDPVVLGEPEQIEVVPLLQGSSQGRITRATSVSTLELRIRYRLSGRVDRILNEMERSYRRLLLAVAGLSGYSLLCLGYMVIQARSLQDRAAREAAQQATLDLADRTCHELGNVVFVLANERRNLADHLDLINRFVEELPSCLESGARGVGLDEATRARLKDKVARELSSRGLDPDFELGMATTLARQICRQIEVCSEYVALTVRELDTFLKHAKQPVQIEPVVLSACVEEALTLLGPRLDTAGAALQRPDPTIGSRLVMADRRLLVHALVNLIKNALEAGGAAGQSPRLELRAHVEGTTMILDVSDHGPGIPPDRLKRIFDAGYSTKGPGRGRGLAIARESVQVQGGSLTATSTPGQGSVFSIRLPLAPVGLTDARRG